MNKIEDLHEGSKSENSCSNKVASQDNHDTSISLKIEDVYSLRPSEENDDKEQHKSKNRSALSFYEQYKKNSCKDFSVVLLKIDSYLTGRDRVHYRQWKRRFQRCGMICRKMKVWQMLKAKRREMREREKWRLEQLDHIERVKKLLDQEPDTSQSVNGRNFHAYLAATNSRKDKDLPSEKNVKPLVKLGSLLNQYNEDEASFYKNYGRLRYESVYENFKKLKKDKKAKNDHQVNEYNKSERTPKNYKNSNEKSAFNSEQQNIAQVQGGEDVNENTGKSVKKQIAAVTPTYNYILPQKDSTVKTKNSKQEHVPGSNDVTKIDDLSKFITSKDGKPLKYLCTVLNGRVALVPVCENPPTSVTQNGSTEAKSTPVLAQNWETQTSTSKYFTKEKFISASQIKVESIAKPDGTVFRRQENNLGNLKSSFSNYPVGKQVIKTTENAIQIPFLHQEIPKHLPLASSVLNIKTSNDKHLGKTSSRKTLIDTFSSADQTKSQMAQGTGVINTFLIPTNSTDNNTQHLLGQSLNSSVKIDSNQKIQTNGNLLLLPGHQVLVENSDQLALRNQCMITVSGSNEQGSSPAPVKSKGMEDQLMVTTSTASSHSKTAFQLLQERNATLKIPPQFAKTSTPQEKNKFEPYKVTTPAKASEQNQNLAIVQMADGKFLMVPQQNMSATTPVNVGQATQVLPSTALGGANQTPFQLQSGLLLQTQPQTVVTNPTPSTNSQLYQLPGGQLILVQQQAPTVQNTAVPGSIPVFNVLQNQTTPMANNSFISLVQNPTTLNNSQNLQTLPVAVTEQRLTLQGTQTLAQALQTVQPASSNHIVIPSGTQPQTLFQLPNGQLLMPVKDSTEIQSLRTATQVGISDTSMGTLGITLSGKIDSLGPVGTSVQGTSSTSVSKPTTVSKCLTVSSPATQTTNQLTDSKKSISPSPIQRAKYVVYPNTYGPTQKMHVLSDLKFPLNAKENVKQHSEQTKSISEMNPILSQKLINPKPIPAPSTKSDLYTGVLSTNMHIKKEIPDDDCYITKTLDTTELNKTRVTEKEVVSDVGQSAKISQVPLKCPNKRKRKEASTYRVDPDDVSRVETYIDISQNLEEKPEASTSNRKKRKPENVCRVDPDFDGENSTECLVESRSASPDLDYSVFLVPKKPVVGDPRIFNSTLEEIGLRLPDNLIR